jgi:hypothetical protein
VAHGSHDTQASHQWEGWCQEGLCSQEFGMKELSPARSSSCHCTTSWRSIWGVGLEHGLTVCYKTLCRTWQNPCTLVVCRP